MHYRESWNGEIIADDKKNIELLDLDYNKFFTD